MPVRDETGKFIGVRPQTAAERRQVAALFTAPTRLCPLIPEPLTGWHCYPGLQQLTRASWAAGD